MTGCSASLLEKQEASDFFSEGFLNQHCFQVLVTGKPGKEEASLIDSREDAFYEAKSNIKNQTRNTLKEYILKNNCKSLKNVKKIPDELLTKSQFIQKLDEIIKSGTIVQEYYKKDNSAILVFRIVQKNLKNRLNSLGCSK